MIAAVPFIMACNQTGQVNATLFPASGSENVNPDTHLVLTFSETPVLGDSGMIRVYDAVTDQVVDSLDLSIPPGPTESRTYGPECDYTKCLMTILVPLCLPIRYSSGYSFGNGGTYSSCVPAYYYRGIYGCLSFLSRHRA